MRAKREKPFQQPRWKFLIPAFTTIRRICFSLKAKPNELKKMHSRTIDAQSKPSFGLCTVAVRRAFVISPTVRQEYLPVLG